MIEQKISIEIKINRNDILEELRSIQKIHGYLPEEELATLAEISGISLGELYGLATFYSAFRLEPVGKYVLKVCHGAPCHVMGAPKISDTISDYLQIRNGETTEDGLFTLEEVACVGCCSLAPVMMVDNEFIGYLNPRKIKTVVEQYREKALLEESRSGFNDKYTIRVGMGSCGIAAGAEKSLKKIRQEVIRLGLDVNVEKTGCVGLCFSEPVIEISSESGIWLYGDMTEEKVAYLLEEHVVNNSPVDRMAVVCDRKPTANSPYLKHQYKIALRNCGEIDPEDVDSYIQKGGFQALKQIVNSEADFKTVILEAVNSSELRGRGGAGFPTGKKWGIAAETSASQKYVICNADEGDPGAFMDRAVLEGDPCSVIEGMLSCALAVGADKGYVYCRTEYPLALERLTIAIRQCEERGILGENIFHKEGLNFRIEIVEGAGAFVCGEESALIASIEGKRGIPSPKPPYPVISGLHGYPTVINNVETLSNIPWILEYGGEAFSKIGTSSSSGTKVFALTGSLKRTGLVEVPMGTTLQDILYKIGGGPIEGKKIKAVQIGGPSGGCIPADKFDTPVDFDSLKKLGAMMGSGGLLAITDDTCMVGFTRFFTQFLCNESCGKCTSCRVGTQEIVDILTEIMEGRGNISHLERLTEVAGLLKITSSCGLGQTAANPLLTSLAFFRHEYEEHIHNKKCTAKECTELIRYVVKADKCPGCRLCAERCSVNAIHGLVNIPHFIDQDQCVRCNSCKALCPYDAIKVV